MPTMAANHSWPPPPIQISKAYLKVTEAVLMSWNPFIIENIY